MKLLFYFNLCMGIIIAVSSTSWPVSWVGLELNLLSFIPTMISKIDMYKTESSLKYFLVQALASSMIILGASTTSLSDTTSSLLISISLLLKAGAAPLHFWILPVMQGLDWNNCLLLSTAQKIAPLTLISYSSVSYPSALVLQFSSICSSVIGSLGGLNQTLLRKIMGYSSISHMAWFLAAVSLDLSLWAQYMLAYSAMTLSVIFLLKSYQIFQFKQILLISGPWEKASLFLSLLSLGGLPPLLGFYPKLLLLSCLSRSSNFTWVMFLLGGSLLTLFYYSRLVTTSFTLSNLKNKKTSFRDMSAPTKALSVITLNFMLVLSPVILSL